MKDQTDPCEVCQAEDQLSKTTGNGLTQFTCFRCGDYIWNNSSPRVGRKKRQTILCGYIREQNRQSIVPVITPELIQRIEGMTKPRLSERAQIALGCVAREIGLNLNPFSINNVDLLAETYCDELSEAFLLFDLLIAEGLAQNLNNGTVRLTPKGLLEAEGLLSPTINGAQGFVAMSFDHEMDTAYELGFYRAIEQSGFRPFRIDHEDHVNGITDQIMAEIRRSAFVVADYTGGKNGVYFEAGFALGLGKIVIPTCRADFMDQLHFDVRHINTLKWNDPTELVTALSCRISAVIGEGPLRKSR